MSEVCYSATDFRNSVEAYCKKYSISPSFQLSKFEDIDQLYTSGAQWPFGSVAGCYAFFSEEQHLLYVGKAAAAIARRTGSYFRWDETRTFISPIGNWTKRPKYLLTVKVNEPYEAPSLEAYLIDMLQPPDNEIGIRR